MCRHKLARAFLQKNFLKLFTAVYSLKNRKKELSVNNNNNRLQKSAY